MRLERINVFKISVLVNR